VIAAERAVGRLAYLITDLNSRMFAHMARPEIGTDEGVTVRSRELELRSITGGGQCGIAAKGEET
jgi:hypothetical protein